jgi:hypothetical protein
MTYTSPEGKKLADHKIRVENEWKRRRYESTPIDINMERKKSDQGAANWRKRRKESGSQGEDQPLKNYI